MRKCDPLFALLHFWEHRLENLCPVHFGSDASVRLVLIAGNVLALAVGRPYFGA